MNLKISEDHPPTIGGWFLSFLLGRNMGFYNVFARCLGLTALRKNVKNLAISCMWSCTISRFPTNSHDISPVFFHDTRSKKNTFGNCFDGVRIVPSHVQGYVCAAEACCGHQSQRIGFAKSFLLQRWQQLRTCHCVSNFKKMYGEGPLTFLMAASGDTETLLSKTQYGFRPNRSTSHAIYVLRRIQDYSEIKGANLSIAFLDWEKHLIRFNMTNLLSLCTDWVSIRTTQMSSPIVIEPPSSLLKIILDVLTGRFNPLGFAKAAHYHLFYVFLSWLVLIGTYNKLFLRMS